MRFARAIAKRLVEEQKEDIRMFTMFFECGRKTRGPVLMSCSRSIVAFSRSSYGLGGASVNRRAHLTNFWDVVRLVSAMGCDGQSGTSAGCASSATSEACRDVQQIRRVGAGGKRLPGGRATVFAHACDSCAGYTSSGVRS